MNNFHVRHTSWISLLAAFRTACLTIHAEHCPWNQAAATCVFSSLWPAWTTAKMMKNPVDMTVYPFLQHVKWWVTELRKYKRMSYGWLHVYPPHGPAPPSSSTCDWVSITPLHRTSPPSRYPPLSIAHTLHHTINKPSILHQDPLHLHIQRTEWLWSWWYPPPPHTTYVLNGCDHGDTIHLHIQHTYWMVVIMVLPSPTGSNSQPLRACAHRK